MILISDEIDYLCLRESDGQASLSLSGNPLLRPSCSASHLYLFDSLLPFLRSIIESITADQTIGYFYFQRDIFSFHISHKSKTKMIFCDLFCQ